MLTTLVSLRIRKDIRRVLNQHPNQPVVLVGSYARNARSHALSDVDLLVVDDDYDHNSANSIVQIIAIPARELRARVAGGDDFAQWALRFGVPISARTAWQDLRHELLRDAPWPDPARSAMRAIRALEYSRALLRMGDIPAAEEQALLGVSHVARAALLRVGLFPLSRPELPRQLRTIDEAPLARALERLLHGEQPRSGLSAAIRLAGGWLKRRNLVPGASDRSAESITRLVES